MQCSHCRNPYTRGQRRPLIVCRNKHTFCTMCTKKFKKEYNSQCLTCLKPLVPNLEVNMAIFEQLPKDQSEADEPNPNPIRQSPKKQSVVDQPKCLISESPNPMMSSENILSPGMDGTPNQPPTSPKKEKKKKRKKKEMWCSNCYDQMDLCQGCVWIMFFVIQLPFMITSFIFWFKKQVQSSSSICPSSYDKIWSTLLGMAIFDAVFLSAALIALVTILLKMVNLEKSRMIFKVIMVLGFLKITAFAITIYIILGSTETQCISTTATFMHINAAIYDFIFTIVVLAIGQYFCNCCSCCCCCCCFFSKSNENRALRHLW